MEGCPANEPQPASPGVSGNLGATKEKRTCSDPDGNAVAHWSVG